MVMRKLPCLSCNKGQQRHKGGLCSTCTKDPLIRAKYPRRTPLTADNANISEEDLNKMIAEQLASVPHWWADEEERMRVLEENQCPPRVIRVCISNPKARRMDQLCVRR